MSQAPDLRFPIGEFVMPTAYDAVACRAAIEAIEGTPAQLRHALIDLTDSQLDTPYRPEGWTVRQVVHHMADSHLNAYCRCKLTLTEDQPTIRTYDEKLWADLPEAKTGSVELSLALLDGLHPRWAMALRGASSEELQRPLDHPEQGPMSLYQLVEMYGWHGRHHVAHITSLRTRLRWEWAVRD